MLQSLTVLRAILGTPAVNLPHARLAGVDRPVPAAAPEAIVSEASLQLAPNSLGLLFGRSGSGKTTLMHLVAGLLQPTSGAVSLQLPSAGEASCSALSPS